jgi:glyoxylase-like metal-dependent hydrolase (beta-lactamase superfamily II)
VHGDRHAGHAGDGGQDVIRRIREVTDKPIKYVVLSHYHAVRVLGASAYRPDHIIASQDTYDLIVERGEAGQGQRDRPLPAPVPQRRERARRA